MATILTPITKATRFPNDAVGLEKSLRFLQAISQIAAAYSLTSKDAAPWTQARRQFALGRRYLRFFKFIDCFNTTLSSFDEGTGLSAFLKAGKFSCLGIYLFLESCTLLDAMEVLTTSWGTMIFLEANKFWFYSLLFSLTLDLLQLVQLYTQKPGSKPASSEKVNGRPRPRGGRVSSGQKAGDFRLKRRKLIRLSVIDACDLLIPGLITGWIETSSGIVGIATAVSTALASVDVWERISGK